MQIGYFALTIMNRAWWYELLCITCMCASTTLLMTGYDTQSFVVESILHSVHMREPKRMDKHAGYYGQAVLYGVYTFATLFAPWPCYRLGSKWSLFVGSVLLTLYLTSFLVLNSYYFYIAQGLMGIGFAIFYCGQGVYVSEHSTKATITRNSMLIGTIGNCSMVIGGIALIIIFYIRELKGHVKAIVQAAEPHYRYARLLCELLSLR
ncbi:hypothetical protein OESDEN_15022 [Oesophagostomum dentatum]|uniref:Major facilitator superfamily (MFS) profile domain-containing protein n=1 Tax=Oesophagostomum dentatum TaxID=61180 RepID=A0A0B1SPZ3_OESDE|nr:hypothetical protein OESDEN_15022 [Oesophagostomum dentatum]